MIACSAPLSAGEIPSNKVYEDDLCYAFYDIAPQAPTHFLVIPKSHIGSVAEISGENSAVVAHIFEVIAKVSRELGLESYPGGVQHRRTGRSECASPALPVCCPAGI